MGKVTFSFTGEFMDGLKEISKLTGGKTVESVFCEALNTYLWILEHQKKGYSITATSKDRKEIIEVANMVEEG